MKRIYESRKKTRRRRQGVECGSEEEEEKENVRMNQGDREGNKEEGGLR